MIKGDVDIVKSELILYDSSLSDHVGIATTIGIAEPAEEAKEPEKEEVPEEKKEEAREEKKEEVAEEEKSEEKKEA